MQNRLKKTLILGASTNPARFSYKAALDLLDLGHPIVLLSRKKGEIRGHQLEPKAKFFPDIDTVTMYLSAHNQLEYYQYLIALEPKRVIFNPGSENPALCQLLEKHDIQWDNACTLVLLSLGNY